MRISAEERAAILAEIQAQDPHACVYLFGSRARDDLKGGDIDLLVISPAGISFSAKLDILVQIKARIGEQKIDLKIVSPEEAVADAFVQSILPGAKRL